MSSVKALSTVLRDPCYGAARAAGVPIGDAPAHRLVAGVCSGCGVIPCPMPGEGSATDAGDDVTTVEGYCDADLYLDVSGSFFVELGLVAHVPLDIAHAVSLSWRVTCPLGHVVLLPPDTAEEDYDYDGAAHTRLLATVARLRGEQ